MSVASSLALPQAPATRLSQAPGGHRLALLFAVILTTSLSAVALSFVSLVKPIGGSDVLPDYAAIAPHRGYLWAFFAIAAVQLIVGAVAVALAAVLLAPDRGARWATAGGGLVWLGAAIYGVGVGGWAAVYYFATDPRVLSSATGQRLIDHVNDDTARMLAVPIGGALLVAVGSLLLAVALWRAGTVPRWVPIIGAASTLITLLAPPDGVVGLIGEAASSATSIAVGWYAWRRQAVTAGQRR
jgi:Domain of unknown function (DUF4386)